MAIDKKLPLQTSNNANVAAAAPPKAAGARSGKTIEEIYQKKSQLEHILLRPDTYIGSIEKHTQTLWVYQNDKMINRSVTYVPGLYKIFDEILVNAADNKQRDPSMNSVKVEIDQEKNFISVYNNGNGVPVEIHQEEGIYVPEMIFGHLLTSSNYDDEEKKTTGGRNGYGAKLTNIFSTEFIIETADGRRQKKYKQVFSDNMGKKNDPIITKCKESENWTKVSFKPDLAKFNMTELEDDVVALMKKRVVDLAGTLGKTVKIELNGQRLPVKDFTEYVKLYLQPKLGQEPHPEFFLKVNDRWEICVSLSDGQFQQVSFVNRIATIKGGTHVDYITNQISNYVINLVNKKKKNANLKPATVKNHLWVFVNSMIDNPAFDSQTKETLTTRQSSFGSKCELPEDFLKKVAKSELVENLLFWVDQKAKKDMKKTDGAKKHRVGLDKLEDANDAGGKNSDKCTLILTEGDSAKSLAVAGISVLGRDHYGVFPLRGKLLNVREASHKQIMENAEIQHIKQILGLQQGKEYTSVKSLRYGHLMIMTDQDHDGSHIKGLLINFIHSFWPSLLKIPSFLVEFITPIVKVTHKRSGEIISFYSMPEYESWKESLGGQATEWSIKYYKGLGTSTTDEGKEYFSDIISHKKDFVWVDDEDGDAIELAFSKKKIEARKNWLRQLEPGTHLDQKQKLIKYSDFVNKELILFSMADLQRSIPSMVDGLKPGQRKILFCSFKRNFVNELKVSQFSGYVSEHSAYHHGEASLASTIVGMAQDFVGSNNINLLKPNGQFGTRDQGGKDHASARYIYTQLAPLTRYLFHKDDDRLLDYLKDDGQSIEPTWYMPVIPMVLVNGSEGIGTGWSTFIPNYNPRDIIANIRRLLNGEPMEPMDPWYKGFRGSIEKTTTKEGGASYTSTGIIEEINETTLRITELPIRKWTQDYNSFLNSYLIENDKAKDPFIEDIRKYGDVVNVHIEIILSEKVLEDAKKEGLLKKFKLTSTFATSNMHLFDSNGVIRKYDTPEQILEEFFHLRLEFYDKRKRALVANLERELLMLENKVRFILAVVNGEIIVNNRKRADLVLELHNKGFDPFPKKTKGAEPQVAGETDNNTEENDDNSEDVGPKGVNSSDYDYLLNMTIGTLTIERVKKLCEERDRKIAQVIEMKEETARSLWLYDLAALERELEEQDKRDVIAEARRKLQNDKISNGRTSKAAPKKPRKNTKKAPKEEPVSEAMETSNSSPMETDNAPAVVSKPKGKAAAAKKAPARKPKKSAATLLKDEDEEVEEDEILSLRDRLAAHNINSSPELSEAMETEGQPARKALPGRAAARKKPVALAEISDDDDEMDKDEEDEDPSDDDFEVEVLEAPAPAPVKKGGRKPAATTKAAAKPPVDDDKSDNDFEVEVVEAPAAGKKKGGRKPAAATKAAAAKPPAAAPKKRGPAIKQTLITEVLKPAAGAAAETAIGISPEKKVRKMSASPFNKKSGSVLGSDGKSVDVMASLDEENAESQDSAEVAVAPKARPARGNRGKAKYVLSDSESEPESEDSDFEADD